MNTQSETNKNESVKDSRFKIVLEKRFDPEREDYRFIITDAWKDIHHSRVQEWSSLGVVAAIHVAIIQLMNFLSKDQTLVNNPLCSYSLIIIIAGILGVLFAIIGILITDRHRKILITKLSWITMTQYKLGLMFEKTDPNTGYYNDKGVIPLESSMQDKLNLYENELNKSKNKDSYGIKSIRLQSTSSLIIAFYLTMILLDCFLIFYFIFR